MVEEPPPPTRRLPPTRLQLTPEEAKVLTECRRNSLLRGISAGLIAGMSVKYLKGINSAPGFLKKRGFPIGIGFCAFLVGIGSYKSACQRKILKLQNSQLADLTLANLKRRGVQVDMLGASSEFQKDVDAPLDDDPLESPQNKRLAKLEEGKSWEDIRNQSRQPVRSPTSSGKGNSWNDIRMKNRANHGDQDGLTLEEEDELERKSKLKNRQTSALDFSIPRESRSPSSLEEPNKETEHIEKTKKNYRGIPMKNEYGDEIM